MVELLSIGLAKRDLGVVCPRDGQVFANGGHDGRGNFVNNVEMINRELNTENANTAIWRNVSAILAARIDFSPNLLCTTSFSWLEDGALALWRFSRHRPCRTLWAVELPPTDAVGHVVSYSVRLFMLRSDFIWKIYLFNINFYFYLYN